MDCLSCKLGKSKVFPFLIHQSNENQHFDMINSDLWRILHIITHSNYKYFINFINHHSQFTWVNFLKSKDEAFTTFIFFFTPMLRLKFRSKLKFCVLIMGEEYTSNLFQKFLQENGILSRSSYPSTT